MAITKEQLQKKTMQEIDGLIFDHKQKIAAEKDFLTLGRLNSELASMQEVRDQKMRESGGLIRKSATSSGQPALKSYDDYVKSKKK